MVRSEKLIEVLEKAELNVFHYMLLIIGALVYALTAMNVMLIGSVMPLIKAEWNLTKIQLGFLASAGYAGMFLGALSCGILADIIGRKKTLMISIILMSVFTALCSLARDMASMSILRFLAGIGLGSSLPQPGVYVSEYIPAKYRGRFIGLVESSWAFGALLAILFPLIIIPNYGWRVAFLTALTPLVLIPLIAILLPESIRYLKIKERLEEAEVILRKWILMRDGGSSSSVATALREVLAPAYRRRTALLWILWFSLCYTYHGIFIFLPTIYAELLPPAGALYKVLLITLVQIPGYFTATFLLDRIGRKPVLIAFLMFAGIGSFMVGLKLVGSMFLWSCVVSFFNLGAWAGLYTYTPELYPTRIRGTGSGTAASIGRIAGILTPIITGYLLMGGLLFTFTVFALIHIIAAIAVATLGIETAKRTLEEISQ